MTLAKQACGEGPYLSFYLNVPSAAEKIFRMIGPYEGPFGDRFFVIACMPLIYDEQLKNAREIIEKVLQEEPVEMEANATEPVRFVAAMAYDHTKMDPERLIQTHLHAELVKVLEESDFELESIQDIWD
jgi:hypothetical protein